MKKKAVIAVAVIVAVIFTGVMVSRRLFPQKGGFEDLVLAECGISGEDITKIFTGYGKYESYTVEDPQLLSVFNDYFSRGSYTYVGKDPYKGQYRRSSYYFLAAAEDRGLQIFFHFLLDEDGSSLLMLSWQGRNIGQAIYEADFDISLSGMMDAMGLEHTLSPIY